MALSPTDEQTAILEAFKGGGHLAIQAGAGTGKTSTLVFLSEQMPLRRGHYVAFNRAIALDAAVRFPSAVTCRTAHSLAYSALGHRYRSRLNSPRRPGWRVGQDLGLNAPAQIGRVDLMPATLSNAVLRTVARYCQSADKELAHHHVPHLRGIDDEGHAELTDLILPYAVKAWADLNDPHGGMVRFEHDHYLKMWALTDPVLHSDFLLLDEAQDTNPVLEQIVLAQRERMQIVMVGDSAQAIYGWRGARDVMTRFTGDHHTLTRSFRFGPALAFEANRWLALSNAPIRLSGTLDVPTTIGSRADHRPDAVLCRTNIGAMTEVLTLIGSGVATALVGGGDSLRALARAASDLIEGRRTHHPELVLFTTWAALRDYAEHDPTGSDLQPFANLIDEHGPDAILQTVDRLVPEAAAEVTVSTAHKAKGREWAHVRIAPDFTPPGDSDEVDTQGHPIPKPVDEAEARLAYVAVTRARHHLDPIGLAWISQHPDNPA